MTTSQFATLIVPIRRIFRADDRFRVVYAPMLAAPMAGSLQACQLSVRVGDDQEPPFFRLASRLGWEPQRRDRDVKPQHLAEPLRLCRSRRPLPNKIIEIPGNPEQARTKMTSSVIMGVLTLPRHLQEGHRCQCRMPVRVFRLCWRGWVRSSILGLVAGFDILW